MADLNRGVEMPEQEVTSGTKRNTNGLRSLTGAALIGVVGSAVATTVSGSANAATVLTFEPPVRVTDTPSYVTHTTSVPDVNSRLQTGRGIQNVEVIGTSRFTVTVPTAGVLNISWDGIMGNGGAPGTYSTVGATSGYAGGSWDINMNYRFGPAGGSMSDIGTLDTGTNLTNTDGISSIDNDDGWFNSPTTHFSKDITVTPGVYEFNVDLRTLNAAGFGDTRNVTFTLNGIPEPASVALGGVGALMLLFRRDRKHDKKEEGK